MSTRQIHLFKMWTSQTQILLKTEAGQQKSKEYFLGFYSWSGTQLYSSSEKRHYQQRHPAV